MSVKEIALQRAVATLDALGLKYAIIKDDGTTVGTLTVAKEPSHRKVNSFAETDYVTKVKTMAVGDVIHFDLESHELAQALRSCLSGCAAKTFGSKACITTVGTLPDGRGRAEIFRVQ